MWEYLLDKTIQKKQKLDIWKWSLNLIDLSVYLFYVLYHSNDFPAEGVGRGL